MPEISRFYGIVIRMYFDDHLPPHFHAHYAEWNTSISIADGEILSGDLPMKARNLVLEWLELHRDELLLNWTRAISNQPIVPIEPLP